LIGWLTAARGNVQSYIDDLLVFSATPEEYEAHLGQLFKKRHSASIKIYLKKTVLVRAGPSRCGAQRKT